MPLVALDAGHGGANPGATYAGRREKDDALRLVLELGRILEQNGVDVYYTRQDDIYESPYRKAEEGNQSGADLFVSIHRNSSAYPNQFEGVETLVFQGFGPAYRQALAINEQLEQVGFRDLGVSLRPELVVLNRTQMPSVLVEVGFINSDSDNALFDQRLTQIAQAIANAITASLRASSP